MNSISKQWGLETLGEMLWLSKYTVAGRYMYMMSVRHSFLVDHMHAYSQQTTKHWNNHSWRTETGMHMCFDEYWSCHCKNEISYWYQYTGTGWCMYMYMYFKACLLLMITCRFPLTHKMFLIWKRKLKKNVEKKNLSGEQIHKYTMTIII